MGIFNNPGGDPADSPPRWPVTAPLGVKNESGRKYINMGVKMCVLDMGNPNLMLFFSWDQQGRCSVEPKFDFTRIGGLGPKNHEKKSSSKIYRVGCLFCTTSSGESISDVVFLI